MSRNVRRRFDFSLHRPTQTCWTAQVAARQSSTDCVQFLMDSRPTSSLASAQHHPAGLIPAPGCRLHSANKLSSYPCSARTCTTRITTFSQRCLSAALSHQPSGARFRASHRNLVTMAAASKASSPAAAARDRTPGTGLSLSLVDQLVFYGSYHSTKWNQLVHLVFVPMLVWTVAVLLAYTPTLPVDLASHITWLPPAFAKNAVLNGAAIFTTIYSAFYILLEPFAGLSWALLNGLPVWLTATAFRHAVPLAWAWALGLHVLSWIAQVYLGHTLAEKRKPALLDSFVQSLLLAPLFVWFEVLFFLGYRKNLYRELQARVAETIAQQKEEEAALLANPQ